MAGLLVKGKLDLTYLQARVHALLKVISEILLDIKRAPFVRLLDMQGKVYHWVGVMSREERKFTVKSCSFLPHSVRVYYLHA
ncbi:MAG: hypothetical protein A2Y88_06655 [Chloroflexi bacterium RBG_13_48_10]|nr:MAG: hypothetical protein A2Y88_06655 [Chloroflexi bacterium RBG_13_48_10]